MKLIHIISGVLLFLLIAASSASAAGELSFSNTPGATNLVTVHATYSSNVLTVWPEAKDASVTSVRIDEIGFNRPSSAVTNIVDNLNVPWNFKGTNEKVDDVGYYVSVYKEPGSSATKVIVTFVNNDDLPENARGFEVAAHVAWATRTGTGDGTADGSAFFAGDAQIPEFPTLALPVAAVLGLMFIIQRRKEN